MTPQWWRFPPESPGFVRLLAKPRRIDGGVMTAILVEKTCTPCRGGIPPLTRPEAEALLAHASECALIDEARRIERTFRFRNFREALAFVRSEERRVGKEGRSRGSPYH